RIRSLPPEQRLRAIDVPNRRLQRAAAMQALLDHSKRAQTIPPDPFEGATEREASAIDPDELIHVARALARAVIVVPAGGDDPTRFDAVFLASQDTGAAAFRPREGWSGGRLFNDPLLGRRAPRLRATLSGYVAERLPNHLHPSRYIFLEGIPTRA